MRFVPNDAESVQSVTGLVPPELAERTIVTLDVRDEMRTGARAIFTIVAATGGVIGFVSRWLTPRTVSLLFEPGYRLFAKHRGRFARFVRDP